MIFITSSQNMYIYYKRIIENQTHNFRKQHVCMDPCTRFFAVSNPMPYSTNTVVIYLFFHYFESLSVLQRKVFL
jgi:hypothetical protein